MLTEACTHFESQVFEYVLAKRKIMPRTALRYAIEKLPKHQKLAAMQM
jgi:hypothetical protein